MSGTTAAPWSIPYPENDDAFQQYPALAKAQAERLAALLADVRVMSGPRLVYEHYTAVGDGAAVPDAATSYGTITTGYEADTPLLVEAQARVSGGGGAEMKWDVVRTGGSAPLFWYNSDVLTGPWRTVGFSSMVMVPSGAQTLNVRFWRATAGTAVFKPRDDINNNVLVRVWQL